jgi:hypothetical protein
VKLGGWETDADAGGAAYVEVARAGYRQSRSLRWMPLVGGVIAGRGRPGPHAESLLAACLTSDRPGCSIARSSVARLPAGGSACGMSVWEGADEAWVLAVCGDVSLRVGGLSVLWS